VCGEQPEFKFAQHGTTSHPQITRRSRHSKYTSLTVAANQPRDAFVTSAKNAMLFSLFVFSIIGFDWRGNVNKKLIRKIEVCRFLRAY